MSLTEFCAINWGSIADWVSGFGSLAAVTVALGIAVEDRRRIRLGEDANRAAHDTRQRAALDGALTLVSQIREATSAAAHNSMPSGSWFDTTKICNAVLEQIQRSTDLEPSVRIALQNLAWIIGKDSLFRTAENGQLFNKTLGEKLDDLARGEEKLRQVRTKFEGA